MSPYIFECRNKLELTPRQNEILDFVVDQLKEIKKLDKHIRDLAIAGGFIVDAFYNINPSDLDVRYSITDEKGKLIPNCKCDYIRNLVNKTELPNKYEVDLGNILESGFCPNNSILEKHLGVFSHHTDYISQFILDYKGNIWANSDSFSALINKEYEIRYAGFSVWTTFRGYEFYPLYAGFILRGLGYVCKRDLSIGANYRMLLEQYPWILENLNLDETEKQKYANYFYKKVRSINNLKELLKKHKIKNLTRIVDSMREVFRID